MAANDEVVQKILDKIKHENVIITNTMRMRQATNNPTVQAGVDAQIKAGQQNIKYLEEQLAQMQINQSSQGPKPRPNYSRLDLIKADTPHLGPRYQLMLSQLIFKLDVERKYKEGIEKVVRLYEFDGDKKSRQEAEGRRIECYQKITLLQQALRRYEDLNIGGVVAEEGNDDDSINQPQGRRPLSGHLTLKIHAIKDVQHALASSTWNKKSASFVQIKVEDNIRGTTKQTKNDRWTEELHNIEVDKANEIELTVYDTSSSSKPPSPIGMIWIRLSDVVEEMRRKKLEQEMAGSQWVTAEQMSDGSGGPGSQGQGFGGAGGQSQFPGHMGGAPAMGGVPGASIAGPTGSDPNFIEAWFSLEPVGSIFLGISFVKASRGKPAFDLGLNRKGAVRRGKEEVQERYGHKFVSQQFFNIMRCALCGELLKYNAGMQCEDCRYLCHQKCYPKVVTKCISKSTAESDPDEVKINHRIPHRFDAFSNFSANWCCHCGYMLAVGKRNARKCSECGLTCHASCQHLVPDFCGLPMETANEIIARARGIPQRPPMSAGAGQRTSGMAAGQSLRPAMTPSSPSYASGPEGERVGSPPADRTSYQASGPGGPSNQMAAKAAGAVLGSGTMSSQGPAPSQDQRPGMGQRQQSDAESAAKWAIQGDMRRPQSMQNQYGSNVQELPVGGPSHAPYNPQRYANFENAPMQQQQQQQYPPYQQQQQQPQQMMQQPPQQHQHQHQHQQHQHPHQHQQQPMSQMPGGPNGGAMVQAGAQGGAQAKRVSQPPQGRQSQRRIGLEHFNFLAVLGKGNFGKVMLAETKATKRLYAIKVLKKEFIIENDEVESTRSEKRVFLVANKERHPFLLNLHACFQTETRIYFVMEYISGGDLMLHIQRGQFGIKRSVFYASEVCLALKYFHENGVIYRDLKLDNILLTLDGHIKIADYGLCKEKMYYGDTTGTFCGTPEFMAPEILLDKKYGRAVDWWAFGVLIYQMLLQQSPFRGEDEDEIYDAILADEPLYPIHMPRDSVAILQKLLTREPEHRLGSGPKDAQEIMDQPFFKTVNWDDVLHRRIPPPYLPQIKNATDTANFDSEFTSVTPVLTPVQSVLTQQMQEEFRGFSYTGDFD